MNLKKYSYLLALVLAMWAPVCLAEIPTTFETKDGKVLMAMAFTDDTSYALVQTDATTMITIGTKDKFNKEALASQLPANFSIEDILEKENAVVLKLSSPGFRVSKHMRTPHGAQVEFIADKTVVTKAPPIPTSKKSLQGVKDNPKEAKGAPKDVPVIQESTLSISGDEKICKLEFSFPALVPLAVFLRDQSYWFVFDTPDSIPIKGTIPKSFGVLQQNFPNHPGIFIVKVGENVAAHVEQKKNTWTITLNDQIELDHVLLHKGIMGKLSDDREEYQLTTKDGGQAYRIVDPTRGDKLIIYPSSEWGRRVEDGVSFPDFKILKSLQGAVIVTQQDDLNVEAKGNVIHIGKLGGLLMSSQKDQQTASTEGKKVEFLQFSQWMQSGEDYIVTRNKLEQAISFAKPKDRVEAYFNLIRYNIAHGYGAESLGLLRILADDVPGLTHDPQFLSLRGVAYFLAGDMTLAVNDFNADEISKIPEIQIWKGASFNLLKYYQKGTELMRQDVTQITNLPQPLKSVMVINGARGALAVGDVGFAQNLMRIVAPGDVPLSERQDYELVMADLEKALQKTNESTAILKSVSKEKDIKASIEAKIKLIDQGLADQSLSVKGAISQLEDLRYEWRKGEMEWMILRKLGQLYIKDKNYKKGLSVMTQALKNFPDSEDHEALKSDITKAFVEVFSGADGIEINPITAIGLYESFKTLTPVGEKGDEIASTLSRKLLELDLPQKAVAVLEERLASTPQFNEKLSVELILAFLTAKEPQKAVAQMDLIDKQKISETTREKILYLRVKALAMQNQFDQAINALQGQQTVKAEKMRAGLYWKSQNWGKAAGALKAIITQDKSPDTKLVLSYVMALFKGGDEAGLKQARGVYKDLMKGKEEEQSFKILTSDDYSQQISLDQRDEHLKQISLFEDYLNPGTTKQEPPAQ